MNTLVTGCAGFIGFHVVLKLIEENVNLVGIDSLNSYYDIKLKKNRLNYLKKKNKNFKFYKINLCNLNDVKKIFKKYKFDLVIHLAAQAGVRYSLNDPWSYVDNNITSYLNLLESCKNNKKIKIIFASSSSVYGDNNKFPLKESSSTDRPLQTYAVTKKTLELLSSAYNNLYKINIIGLRFFTVYGPWGRPDMALYIFVDKIINNKTINIFNKGNHYRDFTYIDDLVECIFRIYKSKSSKKDFKIFNIGSNNPVKLSKFISIIEKELNLKAKKKYLPIQKGDIPKTHSDNSKFYKIYKYKPNTSYEIGIKKFINWYKKYNRI